jgi:hypothetical protein
MVLSRISDTHIVIKLKNPQLASKTADTKWCSYRKKMVWDNGSESIYFRNPAGNFVEFITEGNWPVED